MEDKKKRDPAFFSMQMTHKEKDDFRFCAEYTGVSMASLLKLWVKREKRAIDKENAA